MATVLTRLRSGTISVRKDEGREQKEI